MFALVMVLSACKEPAPVSSSPVPQPQPQPVAPTTPILSPALTFDGPVPQNLVMLSIDTLRRDIIGRYDPENHNLSPFLDEIAAQGVAFDDVTACSNWTVASTACMLSGADNLDRADERQMVPILTNSNDVVTPYPEGTPMLASFLRPYGYSSMLLTANNFFGEQHGSAQGYDRFIHSPGSATELWTVAKSELDVQPLTAPYFLHLHLMEPHRPYLPPQSYIDEQLIGVPESDYNLSNPLVQAYASTIIDTLSPDEQEIVEAHYRAYYRAELRWLDDQIRLIWDELDTRGLLDDTLVVLWTDHGEALWEHTYTGHAHLLFPNENNTIVYFWAKNLRPGVVDAPIETADIVPTLMRLWQRPIPPEVTGIAFDPAAPPPSDRVRTAFSDAFSGPVHQAHKDSFLMQFSWIAEQPVSLVDLSNDPNGLVNLYDPAAPHPVARELWPIIEADVQAALPWVAVDPRNYTVGWPVELTEP